MRAWTLTDPDPRRTPVTSPFSTLAPAASSAAPSLNASAHPVFPLQRIHGYVAMEGEEEAFAVEGLRLF